MAENKPSWRNGRRYGLKIRGPKGRVGSIPTGGNLRQKALLRGWLATESRDIAPIDIHRLVPGGDEILDKFLLTIN